MPTQIAAAGRRGFFRFAWDTIVDLTKWSFRRWWTGLIYIGLVLYVGTWIFFKSPLYYWTTVETLEFTVSSAAPATMINEAGQRQLMVYARNIIEDGSTKPSEGFVNEEVWSLGKFGGSSDLQGLFAVDHCYRAKVTGLRISFLWIHKYRIILSAEEIACQPPGEVWQKQMGF